MNEARANYRRVVSEFMCARSGAEEARARARLDVAWQAWLEVVERRRSEVA